MVGMPCLKRPASAAGASIVPRLRQQRGSVWLCQQDLASDGAGKAESMFRLALFDRRPNTVARSQTNN